MHQFGRVLVVDNESSLFLSEAEEKLKPLCSHYEAITSLGELCANLERKPEPEFDLALLDYALILLSGKNRIELAASWKDKFNGKSRLKLLVHMRQIWQRTCIVLMMNYPSEVPLPFARTLGADGCINKNLPWSHILYNLKEIIGN